MLLRPLIANHPKGPTWFSTSVFPVKDTITLLELKDLFYNGFLDSDWRTNRLISLIEIRYQPNELVKDYTNRSLFGTAIYGCV